MLGSARLGKARLGKARDPMGHVEQSRNTMEAVRLGQAGLGAARSGWARQGTLWVVNRDVEPRRKAARPGMAGRGEVWRGEARRGTARDPMGYMEQVNDRQTHPISIRSKHRGGNP